MEQHFGGLKANREQENQLFNQMLELINRQKAQLLEDEVETLVETTKSWDALAQKVDALELEYKKAKGDVSLSAEEEEILQGLTEEGRRLLMEMQKAEQACSALAEEKMGRYKTELKDVQKSYQRVTSYVNPYTISEDGIYFDKKK